MQNHQYIPQTPALKSVVRFIWQAKDEQGVRTEIILPKGNIELIFDLSETPFIHALIHNLPSQLPKCFINGFNGMPIQIHWPSKPDFFGVAFHPLAIKKILRIPPAEYANRAIDLTLIHPEFNSLWHELAEQKTFADRVAIITRWVEGHLVELHPQEQLLNDMLLQIRPAQLTIPALAAALYYSPRHLSRKIRDITDMNSEEFLHYKKFSYAVHLLHHSDLSLTAIAHECHFADQSHFIKTFHKFADRTPGAYKQQKSMLPGHIFEDVR